MHSHIHFSKMIEVLCNTSLIYLLIYLSIYLIMMTTERGGHYRHPRNVLPVTTPYSNSSIYSLTHLITCSIYPSSDWDSAMRKTNLHMLATYGPTTRWLHMASNWPVYLHVAKEITTNHNPQTNLEKRRETYS